MITLKVGISAKNLQIKGERIEGSNCMWTITLNLAVKTKQVNIAGFTI